MKHTIFPVLFVALAIASTPQAREIALTYDDAPMRDGLRFSGAERGRALLDGLERAGVEGAIIFVTVGHFDDEGRQRILDYAAGGHWLANHSFSHRHPDELGAQGYLEDIDRAHAELATMPRFLPLYRYPYLDEGRDLAMRDALREGLAARGYRNGYVTIDTYDWYMDSLLQRALADGRSVDWERLREVYVTIITGAAAFYDDLARKALGRSPRHVLLLHENDLAALYVANLAAGLREQGWTIIPGPLAFEDPIGEREPDTIYLGQGRVAALAEAVGMPHEALRHKVEDQAWLDQYFEAAGVFGPAPAATPGACPEPESATSPVGCKP